MTTCSQILASLRDLPVTYSLLVSAAILLVLGCCQLNKYSVSWYCSLSLPGTLLSAFVLWLFVHRGYAAYPAFVVQAFAYSLFNFGTWVFPIVLCKQIYNLAARRSAPTSKATLIGCGLLAGLYLWWDLIEALWSRMANAFA